MAKDLGTQLIEFFLTDTLGVILSAFVITIVIKYFWRTQLSNQFKTQFENKKYIIYAVFGVMGLILFIIGTNNIVKASGLALIGVALSSMFMDFWEDHLFPFIKTNVSRTIIMGIGIFLILFAGTIESIVGFPVLINILLGILMIIGVWWKTIEGIYRKIQTRYPQVSITKVVRRG